MRKTCYILAIILIHACGNGGGKGDERDGRLQQMPEVNTVEIMTLQRTDFHRQLLSNGKLAATSRADLSFITGGPLLDVKVRNGQRVRRGDVLARVSRPDLELSLESAKTSVQQAEMDLYDYLVGQGYTARDTLSVPKDILEIAKMRSGYNLALNTLHRANYDLKGTVLKAPFSGKVAGILLNKYDQVGSSPFCTLVDDSSFDVDFTVLESEYAFISIGLPVKVTPYADTGGSYPGTISSVNPIVDKNGQISVRARVKADGRLLDGMNVKVMVERVLPGQLVVPRSAVVIRDNLDVLFTYSDDGKAHWTYVNILGSNSESHIVQANSERGATLSEGDRVIISGNLNLADGSDVVLK